MRVLVIGNPVAGPGRSEDRIHAFTSALKRKGHHVEVFLTEKAGDALDRARSVDGTVDRLVVAGGDGTVNEVINGLADPSRIPLLHLPTGTANQLARTLGLPPVPEALVAILEQGNVRRIDLGLANDRRFLLLVSAGFDAKVAAEVKKVRGDKLGYAGYALPLLKAAAEHLRAGTSRCCRRRRTHIRLQCHGAQSPRVRWIFRFRGRCESRLRAL